MKLQSSNTGLFEKLVALSGTPYCKSDIVQVKKCGYVMYSSDAGQQPGVSYGLLLNNLKFIHKGIALTTSTMTMYYSNILFHKRKQFSIFLQFTSNHT